MIARLWRGVARDARQADAYRRHLETNVVPALRAVQGWHGIHVLRREQAGRHEFLVMTYWDSLAAIRAFAGEPPERAVVEPRAREVLEEFDDLARHYEVER